MTSQGSSRVDYFDLTDEDDSVNDSAASGARQSAIAGPSLSGLGHIPPLPNNSEGHSNNEPPLFNGSISSPTQDSNSDIEMMDNAPVDEAARRRNLDSRRERLRASGIYETGDDSSGEDAIGQRRGDSVAEVIVISDGEEANEAPNRGNAMEEDIFGEERRRQRRWNNWEDSFADRRRNANARQPPQDLFDFDFPPHLLPTVAGPSAPRITLGGGGLVSRNRPLLPPILPPSNNAGPSMHRRSIQLDSDRLQDRVRTHVERIEREADREYNDLGLAGRMRNAMSRLGDVFGAIGWGVGADDDGLDNPRDDWGPPPVRGGWARRGRGARGRGARGGFGGLFMGWEEPPEEEEEQPLDLPEAPEWKVYFTHPGKMPHGFTSEFAPVEPELIILEDSDDETRKKGKGKAKQPAPDPKAEARAREALTLVCSMCKNPLILGGEIDNEKVYGLRCGHVLDGKCLWKIGKPQEQDPPPQPQPPNPTQTPANLGKGKAHETLGLVPPTMDINPEYEFTFVPPVEAPVIPPEPGPQSSSYVEDNAPSAARVRSANTAPTRGRDRRGVVPIPNVSAGRRTRNRTRQNALDGVDDDGSLLTDEAGPSTPRLDLSDPFFPVSMATSQRGGGGRRGRGNRGGRGAGGGRTRVRRVPKTNGRLKEQVFEWVCPVAGCGRAHASVRLEMEGAKWKCDPEKGPVLMFL